LPRYGQLPRRNQLPRGQGKRRLAAWLIYLAIIFFFVACLFWLRGIMLPFIIALLIAYILEPLVTRLHGVGVARWIGVILVYFLLISLVALFLRFLVPIINNESGKLMSKLNVAMQEAPQLYERLEGGVGRFLDRIAGAEMLDGPDEDMAVSATDDEWGFGPPVHKIPSVAPPSLSTVGELHFGSTDDALADAGIPEQPRLSSMKLDNGKAELSPNKRRGSSMTIEQVKPGVFGVNLGSTTLEIRKLGQETYSITSKDEPLEANRFSDLKHQVTASMRKGLQQFSTSLLGGFFTFFQGLISGIMSALVGLVIVFLVGGFAMIDAPRLVQAVRANVPARYRVDFDELRTRLDDGLAGVVRGQLMICLVNGILSTIGFLIFIPEYAVVLGILSGVMSLVPIFGTIISSVPALLVALTISFGHALGVLAWILGIHFVEAYVLNPNIIGKQARIHPILVVFVLIAGEAMYGMKGILLAVPATAMVQALIQFTYSRVRPYVI
jgi:predicted PurR-regulated permease PerM